MKTEILMPTIENINLAAKEIRSGGIVAFPTETVYGLGANVFSTEAVRKIFAAKGRPSDNPLIVHIADKDQIKTLVTEVPIKARMLMAHFMPGAITLVLKKKDVVPSVVTGGLDTVAVRMPSNKTALNLIKHCGVPVCAPSANKSSSPSPTNAKHVFDDLNGKIPYILDGGQCDIGLESTVIDVTGRVPKLLRNGGVTIEEIEKIIGKIEVVTNSSVALSPGMKYKHYAPKADVYFSSFHNGMSKTILNQYDRLFLQGKNPVIIALSQNEQVYTGKNVLIAGDTYKEYAKNLFGLLRQCDELGYDCVIAEGVEPVGIGATIINRMVKSSGGNII